MSKKKVVVIGGGNGSAKTLRALKVFADEMEIIGVVSMADSGGANGRMRKEKNMLPPSDLMRATIGLSEADFYDMRKIFYKNRLSGVDEKIDGYYIGIMWYSMMMDAGYTFMQAHEAFEQVVGSLGKTYPVTLEQSDFCVELSNGDILMGEGEIDDPQYDRSLRISRAWLQPTPPMYEPAAKAIEEADVVILGPGSLYTSIIAALAVEGMMKGALRKSKAKFIYVAGDAYEKDGETGPQKLSEFVSELEQYLPRPVDAVLFSNYQLNDKQKAEYDKRGWNLIEDDMPQDDPKVVRTNLQRHTSFGISAEYLGQRLYSLIMNT